MKILVIGGTHFVGRHFVEAALARGHAVTLLNRGRRNPHLFPDVEKLRVVPITRERRPLSARDRGHKAAYSLDLDGHVLAFAKAASSS